jgi:hypothetical protein
LTKKKEERGKKTDIRKKCLLLQIIPKNRENLKRQLEEIDLLSKEKER